MSFESVRGVFIIYPAHACTCSIDCGLTKNNMKYRIRKMGGQKTAHFRAAVKARTGTSTSRDAASFLWR